MKGFDGTAGNHKPKPFDWLRMARAFLGTYHTSERARAKQHQQVSSKPLSSRRAAQVSSMGVNANEVTAVAPAAVKKYHLVEAEEVNEQPRAKGSNANGNANSNAPGSSKKKGKTSWTQLPLEGSDEGSADASNDDASSQRTNGFRNGGRGGRGNANGGRGAFAGRGGGRGPRRNYDSNGSYINGVYVANTDPKTTAQWAKEQIEFYFSPDNLVRDIFLRQHMDMDGFVPLAFVGSFQAVYSVHQDYPSLLAAVKDSELVELDEANEKVRLRDGWQKWLWPNADGGYGVPRYIKAAADDA